MDTVSRYFSSLLQKYWLFLLIILALALRLFHLDQYGLWYDEAISYKAAQLDIRSILTNQIQSSHPPLYYLTLHYWIYFFPDSDFSARMLSVIWNIALIPVVFCLSKKLTQNNKIAFFAVLLIVISPFHITYSQELRMYTQLMFLTTSGILCYLYAVENKNYYWIIFILIFLLAIYTHYFASFILLALLIYEIIFRKNTSIIPLTFSCLILFVLFIPWIYITLNHPDASQGSLRPLLEGGYNQNPIIMAPLANLVFVIFGKLIDNVLYFYIATYITLAFFGIFILNFYKIKTNIDSSVKFLSIIILVAIIVPSLSHYLFTMYFPPRSISSISPLVLILISCGIVYRNKILSSLIYVTLLLSFFFTINYFINYQNNYGKVPNVKVSEFIINNYSHGDSILHTDDFSYIPMLRYIDFPNHARLNDNNARLLRPDSSYEPIGGQLWSFDDLKKQSGRLWLIVAGIKHFDWQAEQKINILQQYDLIDQYIITGYEIYLIDLENSYY